MLVNLHNRLKCLLVKTEFEAGKGFAVVAVRAAWVHQSRQMEPLTSVLELSREEVTAASVVNAPIMLWVNFDAGEVIVKRHVVGFVAIFTISWLVGSILDNVAFGKPELGRLENVQINRSLHW